MWGQSVLCLWSLNTESSSPGVSRPGAFHGCPRGTRSSILTSVWICRQKWTLAFSWMYWHPILFCSSINLPFLSEYWKEKCWRSFGEFSLLNPSFYETFIIALFHLLHFFMKSITLNTMEWDLTFIIWTYEMNSLNLEVEIHLWTWVNHCEVTPRVTEYSTILRLANCHSSQ